MKFSKCDCVSRFIGHDNSLDYEISVNLIVKISGGEGIELIGRKCTEGEGNKKVSFCL